MGTRKIVFLLSIFINEEVDPNKKNYEPEEVKNRKQFFGHVFSRRVKFLLVLTKI